MSEADQHETDSQHLPVRLNSTRLTANTHIVPMSEAEQCGADSERPIVRLNTRLVASISNPIVGG